MSEHQRHDLSERLIDLCADHAAGALDAAASPELERLDADHAARDVFEQAAASIDAGYAHAEPIDMPHGLMDRICAQIPEQTPASSTASEPSRSGVAGVISPRSAGGGVSGARRSVWLPWTLAAASLTLAAVMVVRSGSAPAPMSEPTVAQARQQLIEQTPASDLLRYSWTATDDPAVVGAVSGDLVWDDDTQRGYMRISGLEVNDPTRAQYQLWIFDSARPQGELPQFADAKGRGLLSQRPIDGGVFDVTETGEVIIEIDAKLRVREAMAFAVTVEPPGGVVVSDRSRVPLLALPPQG